MARNCKCGHKLHEKTCQEPVKRPCGWIACGCFRVNGQWPQEWREYFGEKRTD